MRAKTVALVSIVAGVGALAAILFFNRTGDRTRNDALLFLDRYEGLDADDPIDERRTRIETIAALPFASDEVDAVRDQCVAAHRTLIRAEERGAEARALFEQATEGGRNMDIELSTEVRASLEAALAESNEALPRAREELRTCMERTHRLGTRFRRRAR